MSQIAVIITDMFEDVEYTKPAEAFREAGHKLVHIGLKAGETVHGKKEKTPVKIDRAIEDVAVDDFDALLIPGGYSPTSCGWMRPRSSSPVISSAATSRCSPSATRRSC